MAPAAMRAIKAKEKVLQKMVNDELNDIRRVEKKGGNVLKEYNDLSKVFAKVGAASYSHNFPNLKTLKTATGMSYRNKGTLHKEIQHSKRIHRLSKLDAQLAKKQALLESLATNPNQAYRDIRTGQKTIYTAK